MAGEQVRAAWEQSTGDELDSWTIQRLVSKLLALYASALVSRSKYDRSAAIAEQAVELGRTSESLEGETIGRIPR